MIFRRTHTVRALTVATALAGALVLAGCAHHPSNAQIGTGAAPSLVAWSAMRCLALPWAPWAPPPARRLATKSARTTTAAVAAADIATDRPGTRRPDRPPTIAA